MMDFLIPLSEIKNKEIRVIFSEKFRCNKQRIKGEESLFLYITDYIHLWQTNKSIMYFKYDQGLYKFLYSFDKSF